MEAYPSHPEVVILVGPPGSGKDTQAARLVEEYGFVQVPSSQIIRAKFAANPSDPVIQREKVLFDTGKLNNPQLVSEWIMEFVSPLAAQGKCLVFSGSPRTPYEAEYEYPALQKLYGREHVVLIYLDIDIEVMKLRIAGRRFCAANNHVIPGSPEFSHLTTCPQDGSALARRELDDEKHVDTRAAEFRELTKPVVLLAGTYAVPVFTVDGRQAIEAVHHEIAGILERRLAPAPVE